MKKMGLKILQKMSVIGNRTYLSKKIFSVKKEVKYSKVIPVGWYDYSSKDDLFEINFNQTHRILILGGSGTGKSWLARAMMNRLFLAGLNPIILTDLAPEYYTSLYPLQEDFRKFLLKDEEPLSLPIKIYYPYFLYNYFHLDIPGQQLTQFKFSQLRPTDLVSFLDYEQMSFSVRMEVEDLIIELGRKKYESIDEVLGFINNKSISPLTKQSLMRSLSNLKKIGVFGEKFPPPDIIKDFNENYIPDINLFGWQRTDFKKYIAVYLAILLREILVAKRLKTLKEDKHVVVILEELQEFAPRRGNKAQEVCRREIESAILTGRKEKISFIGITQSPDKISPVIIDQCDYIFIPRGFERSKLMELVKNIAPSYYISPYEFGIEMARELASLRKWRDGMREWLVIERGGDIFSISPLAPLSHHKLEGEAI